MLITNAGIITGNIDNPFISDGAITIEGTRIVEVGESAELTGKYDSHEILYAKGSIVTPGLVNAHMHLYSSLARGMPYPKEAPKNFVEILEKIWWKLDKALTLDDVQLSAMVGLMESAKWGVTTVIDHHSSPNAISGSLNLIGDALKEVGLRGVLCYEVSDRDGASSRDKAIKENADFLDALNAKSGDLAGLFGLHASFTLSDDALDAALEANSGHGFHIHVGEDRFDLEDAIRKNNVGVVQRLSEKGILTEKSIAAHCVYIVEGDTELLNESGVLVTHQPQSNANNGVGRAGIPDLLKKGVRVALGTDSYTHNILEEAHFALLNHDTQNNGPLNIDDLKLILSENACAASGYLNVKLGIIEAGAEADILMYDYDSPTPMNSENIYSHLFYGLRGEHPKNVIAKGEFIVKDFILTKVNEETVLERSRKASKELWDRL
ncbi:putative aminohydrolase SsnA [Candidatus Marinimicrobia bacterium MT.SAG.3]|nr:putative aminohydrolase SsnA [Candidatus Marinimicrobia bacterium MT.SAG.3]